MANNNRCGCSGRGGRDSHRSIGCLGWVNGFRCADRNPYYRGPCPDRDGCYRWDDCDREDRCGGEAVKAVFGQFTACQPMAVAARGSVPLTRSPVCGGDFDVSGGRISLRAPGTYLATMTISVPPATEVASTFALNKNGDAEPSAILPVETVADAARPYSASAQAIFTADEGDVLSVSSSDTVAVTEPSVQPMVSLTLVRLDG